MGGTQGSEDEVRGGLSNPATLVSKLTSQGRCKRDFHLDQNGTIFSSFSLLIFSIFRY